MIFRSLSQKGQSHTQPKGVFQLCSGQNIQYQIRITLLLCGVWHIKIKFDEDPEYYQSLSLRLQEIVQKCENPWEELVQQLLLFCDGMEQEKTQKASDLGLDETEYAFHGALMREITRASGDMSMDEETKDRVLDLTKELVAEFQQATQIAGFFQKEDEIKSVRKKIRRAIIDQPFSSKELIQAVSERFLELGKVRFK